MKKRSAKTTEGPTEVRMGPFYPTCPNCGTIRERKGLCDFCREVLAAPALCVPPDGPKEIREFPVVAHSRETAREIRLRWAPWHPEARRRRALPLLVLSGGMSGRIPADSVPGILAVVPLLGIPLPRLAS